MRVLIVAHGDRPSYELLARLRSSCRLTIAADGAANELTAMGLPPDIVLGDFDSMAADLEQRLPHTEFLREGDQESSDLDKALACALARGATEIMVAGALGGRLDHTLTAIALLFKYRDAADIRLVDDLTEAVLVSGGREVEGSPGDTLSLIPFEAIPSVSASGLRWPLRGEPLGPGSRGVSNVMKEAVAKLTVSGGALVAVRIRRAD